MLVQIKEFIEGHYVVSLTILFIFSFSLFYLCKHYILKAVKSITKNVSTIFGRVLFDPELLSQLSLIVPFFVFYFGIGIIPSMPEIFSIILKRFSLASVVLLSVRSVSIALWKLNDIYTALQVAKNRPIKGIIQVVMILLYGSGGIVVIAILVDRSPLIFLSGLGAMTAILLLVFRDTILSLVAGVQLTTNNLIQVGDWIDMPQFNADGDVIDIALHSVKVQNWDKTITVIPTHKFLENSFRNWRGMQESGGRRIKRSILIDVNSIRFLENDEIEKFRSFLLLKDYIALKMEELRTFNAKFDEHLQVNARRLTNIGTFRAYALNYLKQHPNVNQEMTQLVRQLAPNEYGLPLEIYIFTNDVRWGNYESIQSDIFDHLFAILPEFNLRICQTPTGNDVKSLNMFLQQT